MADRTLPKEQVEALEKILGVKLPEDGFSVEIKPLAKGELNVAQLDVVSGGKSSPGAASADGSVRFHIIGTNWSMKV